MEEYISQENLTRFDEDFHSDRANLSAMNAVTANGLDKAAKRWRAPSGDSHQYSVLLDQRGITNQKQSGRCWMFAALNVLRYEVAHRLNLDEFELSQNYTCFYDKLEKANYFYENILDTLGLEEGDRELDFLLSSPVQDGGQWDMIAALIDKYGVVPKDAMPESACSSSTREMNALLTEKLRGDAAALRRAHRDGADESTLRAMKHKRLEEVYRVLCICLGTPPEQFDFEVRSRDGRFISERGLDGRSFMKKYVGLDLARTVSLINSPTADKPFFRSYTVKFLGNVVGGRPVRYLNVPVEEMKHAVIAQLKDGRPVWFGCDVGKYSERDSGVMGTGIYDYSSLFGTELTMTKADRLDFGHSMMTHAMTLQGVDLDEDGKPVRWRVENSWGGDRGKNGMYLMTDHWFDEYLYQVVVDRRYLTAELVAEYEAEPEELSPWDPMGALA